MIIGHGSIAKLLNDREDVMFFASGVGDSHIGCMQDRLEKSNREKTILFEQIGQSNRFKMMIVYFGTISKFYARSFYIDHKKRMENMVRELAENYTIINLGNVWECTNPNTFRNAMRRFQEQGGTNIVLDEYKYMISKEQLNFITDNLPLKGKHEISVFGEMKLVKDCLI